MASQYEATKSESIDQDNNNTSPGVSDQCGSLEEEQSRSAVDIQQEYKEFKKVKRLNKAYIQATYKNADTGKIYINVEKGHKDEAELYFAEHYKSFSDRDLLVIVEQPKMIRAGRRVHERTVKTHSCFHELTDVFYCTDQSVVTENQSSSNESSEDVFQYYNEPTLPEDELDNDELHDGNMKQFVIDFLQEGPDIVKKQADGSRSDRGNYKPFFQAGSAIMGCPEYSVVLDNIRKKNVRKCEMKVRVNRDLDIGTLGSFVIDDHGQVYLFTCHHIFDELQKYKKFQNIMKGERVGDNDLYVYKSKRLPVLVDRFPNASSHPRIRQYLGDEYLGCIGVGSDDEAIDFALIKLDPVIANDDNIVVHYLNLDGEKKSIETFRGKTRSLHGKTVYKDGRVSGITSGRVLPIEMDIKVLEESECAASEGCFFVESITKDSVTGQSRSLFSEDGDSGALITSEVQYSPHGMAYGIIFGIMYGPLTHYIGHKLHTFSNITVGIRLDHCFDFANSYLGVAGLRFADPNMYLSTVQTQMGEDYDELDPSPNGGCFSAMCANEMEDVDGSVYKDVSDHEESTVSIFHRPY